MAGGPRRAGSSAECQVSGFRVASGLMRLPQSALPRYALAVAAFLMSLLLRGALEAWLSTDRGFIVFLPAVILTTFFAGLGPAIVTALLSGVALWYFFLPPSYSFALTPAEAVGLATFAFGNIVAITLVHWLRVTVARLEVERARAEALLSDMTLLHELGNRLALENSARDECLDEIIDAAIGIAGADKGNLQVYDADSGKLTITAQRGFDEPFLKFFASVTNRSCACGAAVGSIERVIVEDVTTSSIFAGRASRQVLLDAGVRAVISTPLMSSEGALLGVISTHFARPHRPAERQLRSADLLARQAASYLERQRGQEIQATLNRELQHRSNNLLAVVQSIAGRSLSGDHPPAQARAVFQARLQALARVNRRLMQANWSSVAVRDIVHLELEPFAGRAIVEGADVTLGTQQAQSLSLALHELATNAAKYGALTNGSGRIGISWALARDERHTVLQFKWRESGGPIVTAPTRRGFGTTLLTAAFADVRLDYAADGLSCEFAVPLGRNGNGDAHVPAPG
jgi:two-component sensor histidine kinase